MKLFYIFYALLAFLVCFSANAQKFELQGNVYDYSNRRPIEAVSIVCSCGSGTISDSDGHYKLDVKQKDSIWFSYLGKNTMKYPVDTITNTLAFDIGLHVDIKWLPEVKVMTHNYISDSIENRKTYAKIFNYHKPGLELSRNNTPTYIPGSVTVGLDLDALINVFKFRRNRQLQSFQNRLIKEEEDKYIDHRYNRRLAKQLTRLEQPELDNFMLAYRPQYDILQQMNELELGYYIQLSFKDYLQHKKASTNNGRSILGVE